MTQECIVYHWWAGPGDDPPIHNLRTPIVMSIATLRGCNAKIPIYVLDGSGCNGDWNDFGSLPQELAFHVIPNSFALQRYEQQPGWRNISRLLDVTKLSRAIDADVIIYSDTDVFWLGDPLPLAHDGSKFCFNGFNSGFFYYNKKTITPRFMELFEAFVLTAWNDEAFRYITWQYSVPNPEYHVLDEAILTYMMNKHPYLFDRIDLSEHCTASHLSQPDAQLLTIKMIHANGISVRNQFAPVAWKQNYARGLLPLLIDKLYQRMASVLSPERVYGGQELLYFTPLRIHFGDPSFLRHLLQSRTPEGLLDFMMALEPKKHALLPFRLH